MPWHGKVRLNGIPTSKSRDRSIVIMARRFPNNVVATAFLLLTFVTVVTAVGCIREDDLTLEQRSHQLAGQLMCPVCDA